MILCAFIYRLGDIARDIVKDNLVFTINFPIVVCHSSIIV